MPPRLKNISTVRNAKKGEKSLRTTIPQEAIKQLNLKHNDKILWKIDYPKRRIVTVKKIQS